MLNLNPLVSTLYFLQMFRTAFCIGIFNSKNLPIFLLRRFMPLFIIPLSTLEVNDFQPMGITPAYAGKRNRAGWIRNRIRDHPRLCGEKTSSTGKSFCQMGSPPPMRGKEPLCHLYLAYPGITPAYAGKRLAMQKCRSLLWDHPRLCGEKIFVPIDVVTISGSPPPMRGKDRQKVRQCVAGGITPAYAGKSRKH